MTDRTSGWPERGSILIPNLGGEEGRDFFTDSGDPGRDPVRVAAHLWALLFSADAAVVWPGGRAPHTARARDSFDIESLHSLWPADLGPLPETPAFAWLGQGDRVCPWLRTTSLEAWAEEYLGRVLEGPRSDVVSKLHDKAFALAAARDLDLAPSDLLEHVELLSSEACRTPDETLDRLRRALDRWPDWMGKRFTLKPRFGSSGRGRIAGRDAVDTPAVRGALPRMADRGGAIFEPWLDRRIDLSCSLWIPPQDESEPGGSQPALPRLLGTLEMLTTPGGGYRGHAGEVDSRGRVFSGHRQDEALRAEAAQVAGQAVDQGFSGPCGVDAFEYLVGDRPRMRGAVEFNARPTMGLVAIGLVRRALPRVREGLSLEPGGRKGFLLLLLDRSAPETLAELLSGCSPDARALDLSAPHETEGPRPVLVFDHERERLREAHRDVFGR